VRRRAFVAGIAALIGRGSARAQSPSRIYRLGALLPAAEVVRAFNEAVVPELAKLGYVEGRNLLIDSRSGHPGTMSALARDLARLQPDAILAVGGEAIAASIAEAAAIPIVMYGADATVHDATLPLSKSQGNATGFVILGPELDIKRLEILREAVPKAARIGVLVQPSTVNIQDRKRDLAAAAARQSFDVVFLEAASAADYSVVFENARRAGIAALLIASHPQFNTDARELAATSLSAGLPTMCHWPDMAASGCLLAYGPSRLALFRRCAEYLARIFGGTSPQDLPIERPSQFELVYNLRTAKALDLQLPPTLLARADEVIE
jgi:putative ABC transport system substrate-binding protein